MKKSTGIYGVIVGNFAILLLIVSVAVLILLLRNLEQSVDRMSKDRLGEMLDVAEEELTSFFHPVEDNIRITRHRIEEGIFRGWDAAIFTSYFFPLIRQSSQVSSVMLATTDGRELLILDLDTLVMNRITEASSGKMSKIIFYKADSSGILQKWDETLDDQLYDPRTRPWYSTGMQSSGSRISWTEPYSFFTTGEPGITAVTKWRNRKTQSDLLLAYDLLLKDISGFTTKLKPSKNSKVFVLTDDNRCLGLPHDARFNHSDSIVKYSLQKIDQLQMPAVNLAVEQYRKKTPDAGPFNFSWDDRSYWAGFKTLKLGDEQNFTIGAIVPESDFFSRIRDTRQQIYGGFGLVLLVLTLLAYSYIQKRRDNKAILLEKDKNESLLLNTLPAKVVQDLMTSGSYRPERFNMVSVMFIDIVDFTKISSGMYPEEIIDELNDIYTAFDDIVETHDCERIKTIGDAYMAVCGMPEADSEHALKLMEAAWSIVLHMKQRNAAADRQWSVRIGIHSGGVVGGIVGKKKYLYDIFGDTINTASRMESSAEPMRINVSETTMNLILESQQGTDRKFRFIPRPIQEVKGKGPVRMFYAEMPSMSV